MSSHALGFEEIHHTQLALVGGKIRALGAEIRETIERIAIPYENRLR